MSKRHFFTDFLLMVGGTLLGNWIGGQLRSLLTGRPVQSLHFKHTTDGGTEIKNFPVITKFYPGLLFSLLGRPRELFALLGGTLTGLLVDDHYEEIWLERVIVPLIVDRIPKGKSLKTVDAEIEIS